MDSTAAGLVAAAKRLGLGVVLLGGSIDCALYLGQRVVLTDWKTPGASLTSAQARLVASGVPVRFISTTAQLEALADELRAPHQRPPLSTTPASNEVTQ